MSDGLTPDERIARLTLARTERVGPVTFQQLLRREGSARAALERLPELAHRAGGKRPKIPSSDQIAREIEAGDTLGAHLIVQGDDTYPASLATLEGGPSVLWARGHLDLLNRDSIALVGARIASAAGQRFAQGLAVEIGGAGLVVVSGMARGIDAAAHLGSLPTGTVAVLGGGVDDVYPADNADLYQRLILEGCVLSESPIGHRAQARDFPRRNRIISGLARAVVVVEAELQSGSLITARLAAEQGREVLAVPGSPLDPRCAGTNDLIRQGAALCAGLDDVLRAIERPRGLFEPAPVYSVADLEVSDQALMDRVLGLVGPTPIARDDLIRLSQGSAGVVLGILLELSLAGRIVVGHDGAVSRAN